MSGLALVTGASGSIGRAVTRDLTGRGFRVHAWDVRPPAAVPGVSPSTVDLTRPLTAPPAPYDLVVHLAACTENRDDRSTLSDHLGSVAMTVHLLEHLEPSPPPVLVLTSSQLVYPATAPAPAEDDPVRAATGFSAGKIACEAFAGAFAQRAGTRTIACRLSNIVGAHTDRGVVFDFVKRALHAGAGPVPITGAAHHRRSFMTPEDCADAMISYALLHREPGSEVVNIASDGGTAIFEVADIVAEVTGVPFTVEQESRELAWRGDTGTVLPDVSRLTRHGWRPRRSSNEAVRHAAQGILAALTGGTRAA